MHDYLLDIQHSANSLPSYTFQGHMIGGAYSQGVKMQGIIIKTLPHRRGHRPSCSR